MITLNPPKTTIMRQKIHQSQRIIIFFEAESQFFEIWLGHLFEEVTLFKMDLLYFLEITENLNPQKNLWDLRDLQIIITPELQVWIDENINQKEVALGIKKEAFVLKDDIVVEASIEQTMTEQEFGVFIETQSFNDYQQALCWLLG